MENKKILSVWGGFFYLSGAVMDRVTNFELDEMMGKGSSLGQGRCGAAAEPQFSSLNSQFCFYMHTSDMMKRE
ncbi:hypothetical protein [uncultured Dialister sp.]|uniref:hypothetical protein n=1 Tax=uncultured Dialister sp. TaxID=278064 RepID=UPI0025D345BD|nr:hypothetical protein [uncultured Dialister sp.]